VSYPVTSGETVEFSPPSLAERETPVKFKFRWATRQDQRKIRMICAELGLEYFDERDVRRETMKALQATYEGDDLVQREHRLVGVWDSIDAFQKAESEKTYAEGEERAVFEHDDEKFVVDMLTELNDAWPRIRTMAQSTAEYINEVPRLWFRLVCEGWSGLETPFSKAKGIVPDELLDDVIEELSEIDESGLAWLEAAAKASTMRALSREQRKNSLSPVPSQPTPKTSRTATEAQATSSPSPSPELTEISPETPAT
jgi:hypothetical protein